jgi:hypothetical protein
MQCRCNKAVQLTQSTPRKGVVGYDREFKTKINFIAWPFFQNLRKTETEPQQKMMYYLCEKPVSP